MRGFIQKHIMTILVISEIVSLLIFIAGLIVTVTMKNHLGPIITAIGFSGHVTNLYLYGFFEGDS